MIRCGIVLAMVLLSDCGWGLVQAVAGSRTGDGDFDRPVERELTPELIRKSIQKYLEGDWGFRVKAVEVNLLEPSEPIKMPRGIVELRVVPNPSEEHLGRRLFQVVVSVNGKPWKTLEAQADVTAMVDAIAPNRFLKAEEVLESSDLTVSRVRVHELRHPYITDQEDVIGKGAARPLQANTPLRPGFLKKPLTIKKGDRVIIEARRGGLSIHTYGVTKSNGHVGETIMVANADSGRELRAKIVASGLVQVEF